MELKASLAYYNVRDLDRSLKFYTEVLGLKLRLRHGNQWAEVNAGPINIGLHPTPDYDFPDGKGGATVSFFVNDIEAVAKTLKARGAEVGPINNPPRGKYALITDPDGNKLHMIEFDPKWVKESGY